MKTIYKVTEYNYATKVSLVFFYTASSYKSAIKQVANRFGNPHYEKPQIVFNRFGDDAVTSKATYAAVEHKSA